MSPHNRNSQAAAPTAPSRDRGGRPLILAVLLVLMAYIAVLLGTVYSSNLALQQRGIDDLVHESRLRSASIDQFLAQRQGELTYLMGSPGFAQFLVLLATNQLTGAELQAEAQRLQKQLLPELERLTQSRGHVFCRFALVSPAGDPLIDLHMDETPQPPSAVWRMFIDPAYTKPTALPDLSHGSAPGLVLSTACSWQGVHVAQLLAWIRPAAIGTRLSRIDRSGEYVSCVLLDDRAFLSPTSRTTPLLNSLLQLAMREPGEPLFFAVPGPDGASERMGAVNVPTQHPGLTMVTAAPEAAVLVPPRPWEYPLGMGAVALIILAAIALILRSRVQAMVTGARLREAVGQRQWLEEKNRQLEREIAERRLLSTAVEQAAEAIIITDLRGVIQYVNPAFESITGYSRAETVGQHTRMLKSGQHDESFYRDLWDTLHKGGVWVGRFVNARKDGTLYEEEAVISPVRSAGGKTVSYVAVKRDITEQVAMEAQLQQSQKMEAIGELAGGVAHDFNNLLTVILGSCNLLVLERDKFDDATRESVDEIMEAGNRATALTRQLLAFSRRQHTTHQTLDLCKAVASTEKMLRRLIRANIELNSTFPDEPMYVCVDPVQLDQIIINLAVNARDAMPQGGQLRVTVKTTTIEEGDTTVPLLPAGEYIQLDIADTGSGMSEQTKARMFEPFFTTKREGKGTGLGLATVYGIIRQNDGDIRVESELGVGSRFSVYLPRVPTEQAEADSTATEQQANELAAASPQGHEAILLVDDEESVLHMAQRVLENYGYTVHAASNSADVLQLWAEHAEQIRLLLTDVIMPGMSGLEIAAKLGGERAGLRVLYMSAYTDSAIVNLDAEGPRIEFLQKPFTPDELLTKVRNLLDS